MALIDLSNLGRFWVKVKEYVDQKVATGLSSSEFAQKSIESQPDMIYTAASSDGVTFTATVPGVTQLYAGLRIRVKLSRNSASTSPTLNVNSLGAKSIRQALTTNNVAAAPGASAAWLVASCPVDLVYTGALWKADIQRPSATGLYGTVPITSGGTGATTADAALTNLGAASKTYVDEQIAALAARISALGG